MKTHFLAKNYRYTSLSLLVLFMLIAGCSNQPDNAPATTSGGEQDIPFQVLSKSFQLGGTAAEPAFVLVRDSRGLEALSLMVSEADRASLQAVDLEQQGILAAFAGVKPSGGYSISLDTVTIAGDELVIRVSLQENDPTFPKIEATTSPYTLATFDKMLITDKIIRFQMLSGEDIIASGAIP